MITKPEKPKNKIIQKQYATFNFDWVSKKVHIDTFLDWVKEAIPSGAKDVTLELKEDWEYDDCLTSLELAWEEVVTNINYEREYKRYQSKLKKWKKQCKK